MMASGLEFCAIAQLLQVSGSAISRDHWEIGLSIARPVKAGEAVASHSLPESGGLLVDDLKCRIRSTHDAVGNLMQIRSIT